MGDRFDTLRTQLTRFNVYFQTDCNREEIAHIDNRSSPSSLVEVFYSEGYGGFPEESDAGFIPPSPNNFANEFYYRNHEAGGVDFTSEYREAWRKRALRAWPSLVRDVAFVFTATEMDVFDAVCYSIERDVKDGIDCIVELDGETYYLDLSVDTSRSNFYLERKRTYRDHDESHPHIDVQLDLQNHPDAITVGTQGADLFLYGEPHVQSVVDKIRSGSF